MRIVWYKRAYERFLQVSAWYAKNMGRQAAFKFEKDTLAVVEIRMLWLFEPQGMVNERGLKQSHEHPFETV